MKTAGPINRSVGRASGQLSGTGERGTCVHLAKLEHICEYGTVLYTIECVDKMLHFILIPRRDPVQIN
jgi:hypothetical protein